MPIPALVLAKRTKNNTTVAFKSMVCVLYKSFGRQKRLIIVHLNLQTVSRHLRKFRMQKWRQDVCMETRMDTPEVDEY